MRVIYSAKVGMCSGFVVIVVVLNLFCSFAPLRLLQCHKLETDSAYRDPSS